MPALALAPIYMPFVTLCLQPIWNYTVKKAERHIKALCGFKKEVAVLETKLPDVEEKISKAEEVFLQAILQFLVDQTKKEDNMKRVTSQWFPKLKGVYYDVDDVLDKWNTAKLLKEIEKVHSSKKVCCLIHSFYCNRLSLHREIYDIGMEALDKRLKTFEKDAREPDENSAGELIESLRGASSYGISKLYGRKKEEQILLSKLWSGSRNQDVISIFGMGGVGKTALARLVFSNETVDKSFLTIWVSVQYKFNLGKILKTIIDQVNLKRKETILVNDDAIQNLLDGVVKSIENIKMLLVLDDLWIVEQREWNQLIEAFGKSDPSSRIFVTTQNYYVVQTLGAHNDSMIHLDLLSPDDCWKIVDELASEAGWNIKGQVDHQDLRNTFLCKCNGLPLVAHTLKNQLQSENTKERWNQDFRSDIVKDVKILFGPFVLNYYGLSPLQRRCFSYCSVVPRDYLIENDDVVELWMSQDFFSQPERVPEGEGERVPEKEGLECFKILAKRCLFQASTKDHSGDIIKCKMQALVYEFARFLTRHEHVIMEVTGADEKRSSQKIEKARHFTLLLKTPNAQIPKSIIKKKNLRTLFVVRSETPIPPNPLSCDLLVKLTCLRTLNLARCNIEKLPEKLDKLVHLRYLNLSGNPLKTLPNALCYVFNLQSLRLNGCAQLQRLPDDIGKLALKFRHLHIEGCDSLKALPKEIAKLTYLRTLDMFIIPSPDDPPQGYEVLKLEDLNQLEHIQGSIHICRCRNLEDANDLTKSNILVLNGRRRNYHANLKLNFEGSSNSTRIRGEGEILDALKPHADLRSLEIRGCMDTLYPTWISSLTCLKRLVLCGCRNWVSLPPLGILHSLESLQIDEMDRVVNVDLRFLGIESSNSGTISFPKLKELSFSCLTSWKIWESTTISGGNNGSKIMPCLASLQVSGCDNLEALPGFLCGIEKLLNLTIDGCTILKPRCQERDGADWDKISHIENIKIDGVLIIRPSVVESQASTSGSRTILTPGSTTGPSTSMSSSNTYSSGAEVQGSTPFNSAIPTSSSTAGPPTVANSSNTFSSGAEVEGITSGGSSVVATLSSTVAPSTGVNSSKTYSPEAEAQGSTSSSSALPTQGSIAGPSTSMNLINTFSSGEQEQGNTSGSSAIPTISSIARPSTVKNSSSTC